MVQAAVNPRNMQANGQIWGMNGITAGTRTATINGEITGHLYEDISILSLPCSNMNIIRSWREQKVMLKRWFPILSDEDFAMAEENRETMLCRLQAKLGKTKAELESIFAELQAN